MFLFYNFDLVYYVMIFTPQSRFNIQKTIYTIDFIVEGSLIGNLNLRSLFILLYFCQNSGWHNKHDSDS